MMILRTPTVDDLPAMAELMYDIWHNHYADIVPRTYLDQFYTLEQCHSDLTDALAAAQTSPQTHGLTAAFQDNSLLGFIRMASGITENSEDDFFVINGFDADLEQLYVQPTARKHGIGHALLHHAATWCQDNNKHSVCLWTFAANKTAYAFYTKHGATLFKDTSYHYVERDVPLQILQWADFPRAILKH